jgi:hypothetical protein
MVAVPTSSERLGRTVPPSAVGRTEIIGWKRPYQHHRSGWAAGRVAGLQLVGKALTEDHFLGRSCHCGAGARCESIERPGRLACLPAGATKNRPKGGEGCHDGSAINVQHAPSWLHPSADQCALGATSASGLRWKRGQGRAGRTDQMILWVASRRPLPAVVTGQGDFERRHWRQSSRRLLFRGTHRAREHQ